MENKHPDILVRLQQLNAELAQEHALLARFTRPIEDQIQQATIDLREQHAHEVGIYEGRIVEMTRLINGLGRQLQERDQAIAPRQGAPEGTPMQLDIDEACARAAHEVNRVYCLALGDGSQASWDAAPDWAKESSRAGVRVALDGATPEEQHEAWCAHKRADGWVYGPVKDASAKTHPCLLPYGEMPAAQRRKDGLYLAVVRAMGQALQG